MFSVQELESIARQHELTKTPSLQPQITSTDRLVETIFVSDLGF